MTAADGPAQRPPDIHQRLIPGDPQDGGYRRLSAQDGEKHAERADLAGSSLPGGWQRSAAPLLTLAHLSDLHVMDHQSPGRAELVDRFSDPDSPLRDTVGIIGTYRAQELFLTSTAGGVMPVATLDGRPVGEGRPGPMSTAIRQRYWELHRDPRYTLAVDYD